jgi:sugar/nucleoside kinase (ribokinase family)
MFTNEETIEGAIVELKKLSALVVVTLGAEGAMIGFENVQIAVPPQVVPQVLDTNGAGDAFAGAFLFGLSRGFTLGDSGFLATTVSSMLVGQFGARLRREQYAEILAKMLKN